VIHPTQVPVVHKCFSPSEEKMNWAAELLSAWEMHKEQGTVRMGGTAAFNNQILCLWGHRRTKMYYESMALPRISDIRLS